MVRQPEPGRLRNLGDTEASTAEYPSTALALHPTDTDFGTILLADRGSLGEPGFRIRLQASRLRLPASNIATSIGFLISIARRTFLRSNPV